MATRAQKVKKVGKQMAKTTGKVATTVAGAVGRAAEGVRKRVRRAMFGRKVRKTLAKTGDVLKTAGKAAAVAAVVATAREVGARKKG